MIRGIEVRVLCVDSQRNKAPPPSTVIRAVLYQYLTLIMLFQCSTVTIRKQPSCYIGPGEQGGHRTCSIDPCHNNRTLHSTRYVNSNNMFRWKFKNVVCSCALFR
jgi:hypothetical protein